MSSPLEKKQKKDLKYHTDLKNSRLASLLRAYDWECKACSACRVIENELDAIMDSEKYSGEEILYLHSLYAPSRDWPMWRRNSKADDNEF